MERHAKANRLASDPSPYLQQHGYNPVDWYPWGAEAFGAAIKNDKPIFLSIGYSTCHWCHVMAHESFEDEAIAAIMNKYYINIKVDREVRPDLDEVYIAAVQAISGTGGWPLSVFLTPQGKPFYGGTYFPPEDSRGRPGFKRVLETIADSWQNHRKPLIESASAITTAISGHIKAPGNGDLDIRNLDAAFMGLSGSFDEINGGFDAAPKFPSPSNIEFLLVYWHRSGNEKALRMAAKTIESIAAGGITDHIGGGIHRYTIDNQWLVPHFEKMLYDQALVCLCSLHLYQITRNGLYAQFARDILGYVMRDLCHPGGGFYSGEDADSPGGEGAFYTWDAKKIDQVLGRADAAVFNAYYGVTQNGNFEGKNILHVNAMLMDLEDHFDLDAEEALGLLEICRHKLFASRSSRPRPLRDEKIITSWNAMMINAFALGSVLLKEPAYEKAAQDGAKFVLNNLYKDGRLLRYWRNGSGYESGVLEDYAGLVLAMVELYQTTFDISWLGKAIETAHVMCDLFEDKIDGGFFLASRKADDLIANPKPYYDGAIASGNSLAVLAMAKIAHLTGDDFFLKKCNHTLKVFTLQLGEMPNSMCSMLIAENLILGSTKQIIISGNRDEVSTHEMLDYLHEQFMPDAVLALNDRPEVADVIPFAKGMKMSPSEPAAYICSNYTCKEPVNQLCS